MKNGSYKKRYCFEIGKVKVPNFIKRVILSTNLFFDYMR